MKFGLVIMKQHPPSASQVQKFHESVEQVRAAREAGFDLVTMGQHYLTAPYQATQPLPVLARLAAESGSMRLAVTVMLLPLLNPVDVAEQVATLDIITEGRFVFGVGLGYRDSEYEAFGVASKERVPRFLESLEVINRLWTEDEVTHHGRFFHLTKARLGLRPVQRPRPPMWFAAHNDKAVERAARMADAWLLNPHAKLPELERQMAIYREALTAAGKQLPAELPLVRELFVAADRETALRECRPWLDAKFKASVAWGQDKAMAASDGLDLEWEELRRDRFIIGDPDDCIRELRRYRDALGVTTINLQMQWPGMPQAQVLNAVRLLGERVLPALA